MADPRYGAGGGNIDDTLARMNAESNASDLRAKAASLEEQTTGRSTGALTENVGVRDKAVGTTNRLAEALRGSLGALEAETRALQANTAAWERRANAQTRGGVGTAERAAGGTRTAAPQAAFIGPVETPQMAQARAEDARRAEAAAIIRQQEAARAVSSAQRTKGTTPEQLAPLLGQREAANQAVVDARAQSKAAQDNIRAQEQAAQSQRQVGQDFAAQQRQLEVALQERTRAEQAAATAAAEAAAASRREASARQRSVISGAGILAAGEGPQRLQLNPGAGLTGGPSSLVSDAPITRQFIAGRVGGSGRAVPAGGEFNPGESLANRNAANLDRVAGSQARVNQMMQQSVAQYGASSQALQRHGALTSEFIQAFSRGEVTLQEFQSQMLTTMGKFGGWAVAGAAVYGVVDALKHLYDGAKEAQSGYVQLTRFIPNVSQGAAEHSFTSISSELNVPIKDVVDTMTIMARTFKTLPEAAEATRAALLASKLDQIAPTASAPALVGISQAFGLDAKGTMGVIDSLNALQRQYGSRVSETLPGLARAAPAALAAGVDQHTLEALVGVGVRAGFSGSQVATAVARSATTFVQKPQDQAILERYGFNPNQPYANLIKQISGTIAARNKAGDPIPGKELRDLAIGLAGPQLGSRTFAGILARGGLINEFRRTAANPGETAAQERQKQLGSISEQVSGIGIGIENFGASLASSGILLPLQALLAVLHQVSQAADLLVSPLAAIGNALGGLPGPLKEIIGAIALGAGAQAAYRSTFGRTAAGALSQVPGLSFLDTPNAQAVRQLSATQRTGLDYAQSEQERASYRSLQTSSAYQRAQAARESFQLAPAARDQLGTGDRKLYDERIARLLAQEASAEEKAVAAQADYLTALDNTRSFQARIAFLKSRELSDAEKVAGASAQGLYAAQFGAPTTLPILGPRTAEQEALARNAAQTTESRTRGLIDSAKGSVPPLAGALGGVGDEVIAQQALKATEGESPGFIAGKFASLSSKVGAGGGLASALGAAGLAGVGSSRGISLADRGLAKAQGIGSGIIGGVPDALGTAFQGILAGQIANAVIPGAAGNFIGSTVTGGSLGLGGTSLINSVLERYGRTGIGSGAGFALGAGLSLAGSGSPITSALGGGAVGFGLGSILTKVLGGIAPEGVAAPELAIPLAIGGTALAAINAIGSNQPRLTAGQIQAGRPAPPPSFFGVKGASSILDVTGAAFSSVASGNLFGFNDDVTKPYQAELRKFHAQQKQLASLSSLNLNDNSVRSFGDIFGQQIQDAFTKTGQDAKTALTSVNHQVTVLAANVTSFGLNSREGSHAAALLQEAAGQTVGAAGRDPGNVDQYIQVAEKADQALQQARDQAYQLADARARTGADRVKALNDLIAAEQKGIDQEYTSKIGPLQQALPKLSDRYNELLARRASEAPGSRARTATTGQLNSVGTQIAQNRGAIQALRDRAAQASGQNYLQNAQRQTQVYSAVQTDIQANTALQVASAGADKLAALRAQQAGDQQELRNASKNLSLSPEKRANEIDNIRAKLKTANQSVAQEIEARVESMQKLQEAEVPLNLPTAAIDKVVADARTNLAAIQANPAAFSQQQVQQAHLALIQAQRQRAQTGLSNIQAQGELAKSTVPSYDPVAVSQADLSTAENAAAYMQAHAKDFNYGDILKAMAAVNSAKQAVADAIHQNQLSLISAEGGIAKAADYGNVVAQSQVDIHTAARQLALARTPLERAQATQQLMDAQNNYNAAVLQHIKNETDLAASLVVDPVQKAKIQLAGAQRELASAKGTDNRITAQANVNNLKQSYEQSLIQQRQSTTEFQLTMQQITTQQAINQLQDLLKLKGITQADRQSILERIRALQTTDNTGGQFDLAPGNIKLPTPYDVRRAVQAAVGARVNAASEAAKQGGISGGRPAPRGHDIQGIIRTGGATIGAVDARTYFTIHVAKDADVLKVADALERATGTRISARARARGIG